MAKVDILIIGGGPAGRVAAGTARSSNPDKKILWLQEDEQAVVPCGIPYILNRLDSVEKNLMPDKSLLEKDISKKVAAAQKINPDKKEVELKGGETISYDKLILATGSRPTLLPITGAEKDGVWLIKKQPQYLADLREQVMAATDIVVVGGGFIGVELADEISSIEGKNVTVVERKEHCLITTFDEDFAVAGEDELENKGVNFKLGDSIAEITGDDKVDGVKLESGETIRADMVILSVGAKPNVDLAESAGLQVGEYGAIEVDEYMKTSVEDIFAVGDCAETKDFFTGSTIPVMLASTAATEARIAGANLYKLKLVRENKGTLGSFVTRIGDLSLGVTGFTESNAADKKVDVVIGSTECANRHPKSLPGSTGVCLKLVFSKDSKTLLGAQIKGAGEIGEMLNMLALAIQKEMTAYEMNTLQIATHPLLTAAPTIYPIIVAAQSVVGK